MDAVGSAASEHVGNSSGPDVIPGAECEPHDGESFDAILFNQEVYLRLKRPDPLQVHVERLAHFDHDGFTQIPRTDHGSGPLPAANSPSAVRLLWGVPRPGSVGDWPTPTDERAASDPVELLCIPHVIGVAYAYFPERLRR